MQDSRVSSELPNAFGYTQSPASSTARHVASELYQQLLEDRVYVGGLPSGI